MDRPVSVKEEDFIEYWDGEGELKYGTVIRINPTGTMVIQPEDDDIQETIAPMDVQEVLP